VCWKVLGSLVGRIYVPVLFRANRFRRYHATESVFGILPQNISDEGPPGHLLVNNCKLFGRNGYVPSTRRALHDLLIAGTAANTDLFFAERVFYVNFNLARHL
jgi:hypothetical protein